jgi:hypothetical protein
MCMVWLHIPSLRCHCCSREGHQIRTHRDSTLMPLH